MSMIETRNISAEDYTLFLATVQHSVFQRLPWLTTIAPVYGIRIVTLGYFLAGKLIAVTPLLHRRIGPFSIWGAPQRKCAIPPATPFCAPASEAARVLPALQTWMCQKKLHFLQITIPAVTDISHVKPDRVESLDNLELPLSTTLPILWQGLSQLPRRGVRKATRSGVRIHWCQNHLDLKAHSLMLRDTYGRQGGKFQPNYSLALYEALLRERHAAELRVMCATHDGQTVAAFWIFTDGERCYYWDAVSREAARDLNANHLLVWCLIRWAHRRGFKLLDFVGPKEGGRGGTRPGIGRFKQSMGAGTVDHKILYWYTPWMGWVLHAYRFFQATRKILRKRTSHA